MVHNVVKGALVFSLILTIGHYVYAHLLLGNNPMELLAGIIILAIGTAMIFMARQDMVTKGILGLSVVVLIIHYIYAHILQGNNPPELLLSIIILIPTVGLVITKEINFKK